MIRSGFCKDFFSICIIVLGLVGAMTVTVFAAASSVRNQERALSVIPKPTRIHAATGFFTVQSTTRIVLPDSAQETQAVGTYLSDTLSALTGKQIPVVASENRGEAGQDIIFIRDEKYASQGAEGYGLLIQPERVELRAAKPAGWFYGVQTLRQLIAPFSPEGSGAKTDAAMPCVEIEDQPRYPWRGLTLDCARHFMSKELLRRVIDLLAYHKLNVLHLHLTDDQGWRIEIKKYPRLTQIGAYRDEQGKRYGGYYTQDDLKELDAYAQSRFITLVPEFEMPGHASAAIASYPELSCHGRPIPVVTDWGIFKDIFCPGKESTFQFLEGVLSEILDTFHGLYIHLGGDEAPRDNWKACADCQKRIQAEHLAGEHELQSYLIRRVGKFLAAHGRRLIGWDEILEGGGLPAGTIVQSWRGMEGAMTATKQGQDVIASPNEFVYFDYPQDEQQAKAKPDFMQITTLEKVYSFQASPAALSPDQAKHILGAECAMWTEHAPEDQVDQQLFPRLCAFSETVWSSSENRHWNDFQKRMEKHLSRLDALKVRYYSPRPK